MSEFSAIETLTYEQAFAELETIVQALEEENHPLEDSLRLYERGQALVKRCAALLETAELKVQQVSGGELQPFESET